MIFLSVWLCVRMICVHMIFLFVWFYLSVWFVWVWFFCGYDIHDDPPVPVAYLKNLNKWTIYSDFLNFGLWKHRILLLTLTFTWGVDVWSGGRGSQNGHGPPDPTCRPPIIWGIFQSIHGGSPFTTVGIVGLTPTRHVLATRLTSGIVKMPSELLSQILGFYNYFRWKLT